MEVMDIEKTIETFTDEETSESDVLEFNKILNINKGYIKSRDYIILNDLYTPEQKVKFMNFLEVIYQKKGLEVKTSKYDNKPYVQTFFNDFLDFLNSNNLTQNELKLCLAIYSILNESNTYGNVLLTFDNKTLSEKTKIDPSNISKVIKSLEEKKVLVRKGRALYLSYNLFFRGDKVKYDLYKKTYDGVSNANNEG
ncbi:hypothetical protein [Noviherbaspirillum pedocola]|uniref:Uncharacterized protein n=1 Tax=Noviherbaspirillum pedocola TaxID=2801341 RepID=A0A934W6J9_9BURK|nr:hypothetical protein [Noviherbaspirillum pedocola]MBK4736317.1 hypothetical protein [Noviherbaspirillum pedocola]